MLLLCSENGLHSKTNASATRVPTSFLMALWTSAFGSSCPNPHLCVICTRSTPLRRERWSALFCPRSKSPNSPGCWIFFKRPPPRCRYGCKPDPMFEKRQASEQDPNGRLKKFRQDLYRRRRLDLCAVARGVLPREADAGEGAGIRGVETDLDRDQRHLLRLAEAGELSQMGARGARWVRVLGEGAAFRHQPPRAGGSRRFHKTVLRFRRAGARRPLGSGALAIRADQEIRRRRFWQISRAAAAQARGPRAAPCGRGAQPQFLRARFCRTAAEVRNGCRVRRARHLPRDRRRYRRFRLCAA